MSIEDGLPTQEGLDEGQVQAESTSATPEEVDAIGDQVQTSTEIALEHDGVAAQEASDAEAMMNAFQAANVAVGESFDIAKVEAAQSREAMEGDFTLSEIDIYDGFRTEILDIESDADLEDLRSRIDDSGLDQEAVDALNIGLSQRIAGEELDEIPTGHDIDESIDPPVEETDDVGELLHDIVENGVELLTETTGASVDLVREMIRSIRNGDFESEGLIAAFARFRDALGIDGPEADIESENEELEFNVQLGEDSYLSDILVGLDPEAEIIVNKASGSNEVYLDLRNSGSNNSLPEEIKIVVSPDIDSPAEYSSESIEAGELTFVEMALRGQAVSFQTQDATGNWVNLNTSLIEDNFEYSDSTEGETEDAIEESEG